MHNYKLTIAYEGTDFHGWQMQPGQATVQGALVDILRKLTDGEKIILFGAGRTDAGVHALGQVASFRTRSELTAEEFQRAFNALLPPSIRVVECEETGPDFHARWQAQGKVYRYRIYRGRIVPPFVWRYVLHFPYPLDEEAMGRAARLFEGTHDYSSFAALGGSEDEDRRDGKANPEREIYSSEVRREGEELIYEVRGKSFLRYMVRKIAGTILDVGRGKLRAEDVPKIFEMRDRSKSGPTLAASGLVLVRVEYAQTGWVGGGAGKQNS